MSTQRSHNAPETIDKARRLEGKRALVTGAGRNVGRAISECFVTEGASVGAVDLDKESGTNTIKSLESLHAGAGHFFRCDVASEPNVATMVDDAVRTLGGIDILVNCVATTDRGATVLDLDLKEWNQVLDNSLTSAFLCTKYVARTMVDQGKGGAIVNIGSTSGRRGRSNSVAYGAAKAGIANLTMSSATQLGEYGIRVNTVTPNKVGSPVGEKANPGDRQRSNLLGRGAEPTDVAQAVAFLVSDESAFITAADLLVDGGSLYGGY